MTIKSIFKQIRFLNQITSRLITEENNAVIIRNFAEESLKILGADYGFAWGKIRGQGRHLHIYKSSATPDGSLIPIRKKRNTAAVNVDGLILDENVKQENYKARIDPRLKSYLVIPIRYGDHLRGNIVLGYKKPHTFSEEELSLASVIGNNVSHLVTINWLIDNEKKVQTMTERQKETEMLLSEEKRKTEFIADAAHEFRTPLAIIRGNIDLAMLKDLKNPRAVKKVFGAINHEVEHLANLISDLSLLVYDESKSGKTSASQTVDLAKMIKHVVDALKGVARRKKISIKAQKMPPMITKGDEIYLEKMLTNIVKNAITYGKERGVIEISGSKNKSYAKINIKDNGVGISKDDLPNIFRRFFKTENARSAKKGGVGLGLAIAKKIAEEHGGDITVKSSLGKGSTFTISLPLSK